MIKVLLTETLNPRAVELLKEVPEFEVVVKSGMSPDQLKGEIKSFEAIVVDGKTVIDRGILDCADNLKIIVRAGIGLDNIDVETAVSRNIEVKDTPFATAITVAEYTLAQMLGICRYIGPSYLSMKEHLWEKSRFSKGMELFGKTAGIIGMGRIGQELAKRELAMGMKVLYFDITDIETGGDARQVSLDELLKKSDFISLHLPANEATKNFVSADFLKKMKSGAVLINVSHGSIVDEHALLKAVEKNKIKAVVLDVFEKEPVESFELIDHEKVFCAPHLGASTVESQERAGLEAISILKEFFNA